MDPVKHKESFLHKNRVVLDTSLFVNPDVRTSLGSTPTEALETFLFLAAQIHILEFYMPPSIFEELLHFVEKEKYSGRPPCDTSPEATQKT